MNFFEEAATFEDGDMLLHAHHNKTHMVLYAVIYLVQKEYMTVRGALRRFILAGNDAIFGADILAGLHSLEHHIPLFDEHYYRRLRRAMARDGKLPDDDYRVKLLKEKLERNEL
uniref:Uncharacterized protein n=1 Tax=Palpitomonas bilix TaxID=652834 RepID=A0A7S3G4E9_9EUKA|mmetsp:Transcript_18318/g.45886  ORF Transcript_18318/g.45886 Transcript_18318/m.45886 type:complete len:114 (+) Transcript_18318:221-562(+)